MKIAPMKLRLINGFYKYLSGMDNPLPVFQGNDISDFSKADSLEKLKKRGAIITDNIINHSINQKALNDFISKLCHDRATNCSGIGVMHDGKLVALYHHKPYSDSFRHVSYSMCKSITQMAIGIAYDEGLLKLDEKLVDIFTEHDGVFQKKEIKELTIEHLLTMRAGVKFDEVSCFFHHDWVKSYMGSELSFEPGKGYTYNSLNSYMLAAVIKAKTGKYMIDYLQEKLFNTMDIHDITWDKCPNGIERGGWGLKLSLLDMLKLGQLYLDHGVYKKDGNCVRLISEEWISKSTKEYTTFNDKKSLSGYCYHLWKLKDGSILYNGVFGQNVYINYKKNIVIGTISSAYETFPDGKLVDLICEYANNPNTYRRDSVLDLVKCIINKKDRINYKTCGLSYSYCNFIDSFFITKMIKKRKDRQAYYYIKQLLFPYNKISYHFNSYATSILPITSQAMYSIYSVGISSIKISFENNSMYLYIEDDSIIYKLKVGISEVVPYEYQLISIKGKEMPIAVRGSVAFDEENKMYLQIQIIYLEEVSNKVIKIYFDDDEITMDAFETPNMMDFINKLIGEEKMRRAKLLQKVQAPDFIKFKLYKVFASKTIGKGEE